MTEPASSVRHQSAAANDLDDQPSRNITVFGHVVADDSLGDVYMVPLCDILDDIKHVLGAQGARLPESNSEISTILRRMNDTAITSSEAAADDLTSTRLSVNEAEATSDPLNTTFCTRCGSEKHTREWCEVITSSGREESLASIVVAPHTPSSNSFSYKAGSMVWYCSACSDGPKGAWQNSCSNCSHLRCGRCVTEWAK